MKPKEIIKKAGLENGFSRKNQDALFDILTGELKEIYDSFNVTDSDRHFEAALKVIRSKWRSISAKIPKGLSDGVWSYFYATHIGPLKGTLCPTWNKRNDEKLLKWEMKYGKKEE